MARDKQRPSKRVEPDPLGDGFLARHIKDTFKGDHKRGGVKPRDLPTAATSTRPESGGRQA